MSAIAPRTFLVAAIYPALDLLPPYMTTQEAKAQMLAHALQESRLEHRRQLADGPARSLYQFELGIDEKGKITGGLAAMLRHRACQPHAARFIGALGYAECTPAELLEIMVYDSVLASGMARLNLYWDANPLPNRAAGPEAAWAYYIRTWNPGKPHRETWDEFWRLAWDTVA